MNWQSGPVKESATDNDLDIINRRGLAGVDENYLYLPLNAVERIATWEETINMDYACWRLKLNV